MEFLLEINTEEMPVSHIIGALSQLKEKFEEELSVSNVDVSQIETFGTCRRLIVVADFAPNQKDREEKIIGPPKAVAFSPDGSFTPAAIGFVKTHKENVDELEIIKTEKGEYVGLKKIEKGKSTQEILLKIIPPAISSLSFPKMMRWGETPFKFSRPIRNILCLFGRKPLNFSIGGISSSNSTTGHKIYFPRKIKIKSYSEYRTALKRNKVVVEQDKRRNMIMRQIKRKLASLEAQLLSDEQLMEKLVYDVEHPYVFLGEFPKKYLVLPIEVLSTAMKEGQSLFSVVKGKRQLPHFLGVADAYKDSKALIRKGNERVLRARLEDAKFFWEQDLKISLRERSHQLNRIIFQEKLGSYEDKVQRLKKIVAYLVNKIDTKEIKRDVIEGAGLAKVDLLTDMVREFPALQGKIGGLYAHKEGYSASVWKAIYEHYQPLSLDDESPSSLTGAILSVADKMDSIVGVTGIGIKVTGSKDPFGLRRNAHGVCKIILEKKFRFSFPRLIDRVLNVYRDKLEKPKEEVKSYCLEFFSSRLHYIFESQGYRYDLIQAALGAGIGNIYYSYLRLRALESLKKSPHFAPMILIAKRVNNILRDQPSYRINPALFFEKEERELYTIFSIIKNNVFPMISRGDFSKTQRIIFRMRPSINSFFDRVLVMTDEKRIRRNRLALLQAISKLLLQVADYSQIIIEG